MRVRKAVFPVAGLGTRFLPATKAMPKEMLPVVDKPLIQYAVEEAAGRRHRAVHLRHRPRQARHRRSFRPRLRARARCSRAAARPRSSNGCSRPGRRAGPRQPTPASRSRSASATRSGARATSSATSRSRSCCPTTWCSPTRRCLEADDRRLCAKSAATSSPSWRCRASRRKRYGILDVAGEDDGRLVAVRAWSRSRRPTRRPRRSPSSAATSCSRRSSPHLERARARRRRRDPADRRAWRA